MILPTKADRPSTGEREDASGRGIELVDLRQGQEQVARERVLGTVAAMPEPAAIEAGANHAPSLSICSAATSPLRTPSSWNP